MASMSLLEERDLLRKPRYVDLDDGNTFPRAVRIAAGVLVTGMLMGMIGLWFLPSAQADDPIEHLVPASVVAVPTLWPLAVDLYDRSPTTIGPSAMAQPIPGWMPVGIVSADLESAGGDTTYEQRTQMSESSIHLRKQDPIA